MDHWSEAHRINTVKQTQNERNRMFHKCMEPFSSIVIQPEGISLQRSVKLDIPMFTIRDIPVRLQYKKAKQRVNETFYPHLV